MGLASSLSLRQSRRHVGRGDIQHSFMNAQRRVSNAKNRPKRPSTSATFHLDTSCLERVAQLCLSTVGAHLKTNLRRSRGERLRNPEADTETPDAGDVAVAGGGADTPRIAVPETAAQHPATAIARRPGRPRRRRSGVAAVIAILDQLQHVAVHLVKPPGIRGKTVHRNRLEASLAL